MKRFLSHKTRIESELTAGGLMFNQLRVLYRVLAVLVLGACIGIPLVIKRSGVYEKDAPYLVKQLNTVNLVLYSDVLFVAPHGLSVGWSTENLEQHNGIGIVKNLSDLKSVLAADGAASVNKP